MVVGRLEADKDRRLSAQAWSDCPEGIYGTGISLFSNRLGCK